MSAQAATGGWSEEAWQDWIIARLAQELALDPSAIDITEPFAAYGLDSLQAVELSGELERLLGRRLPPTLAWDYPSIARLAAYLATGPDPIAPVEKALDLSLFFFASDEDASPLNKYGLLLDACAFADTHPFEAVWTPERHFHALGGLFPNPCVTAAALATHTRRIGLRAGSVVLPLHDPLRVAEEWAMVDQLSGGRVGLAFASGWHADDFVFAPESYEERKARTLDLAKTVRGLWRGEAITRRGGAGQDVKVRLRPRPIQPELPCWLTAIANVETFIAAGEAGMGVLGCLLGQSVAELGAKIATYRSVHQARWGSPGRVTIMLHTFVGDDLDRVRNTVRGPFQRYLLDTLDLLAPMARAMGASLDPTTLGAADRQALLDFAFTRYFDVGALMGTPDSCLNTLRQMRAIGVDEVGCLIDFGVGAKEVMESLEHLARLSGRLAANPRSVVEQAL